MLLLSIIASTTLVFGDSTALYVEEDEALKPNDIPSNRHLRHLSNVHNYIVEKEEMMDHDPEDYTSPEEEASDSFNLGEENNIANTSEDIRVLSSDRFKVRKKIEVEDKDFEDASDAQNERGLNGRGGR